jgi:DNA-binding NtrC family response regulator
VSLGRGRERVSMTVAPAVRLLLVTDDSLFGTRTTAAVDRYPDMSVFCTSRLSTVKSRITDQPVDCVVLDTDLSLYGTRQMHQSLRSEWPQLPVVLAASRPRSSLPASVSSHAFVQKRGPAVGRQLVDVVRILTTANPVGDHDTAPATVD